MGTTLTGTTPQDTYEALIKVGDNGIITGSLKTLSDGEGNDSALALSTGAASIAGTLAVTGNAAFDTDVLFVDAANNRVGIGTASPNSTLHIVGTMLFNNTQTVGGYNTLEIIPATVIGSTVNKIVTINTTGLAFEAGLVERMRITSAGNVGIGTTSPAVPLDVVGNIRSSTGILFGSDTAAANALDDYEEGTWTMGVSFGDASVGVTASANTGTYTKIGRQVTVNGFLILTSKGSSTGIAAITGLPFTIDNGNSYYSAPSLRFTNITFANQFQGYGEVNTTNIVLNEITEAGALAGLTNADFANDSNILLSFTYFV